MATPRTRAYSAATGAGIYGGRYGRPAWRRAMAANTWAEIPSTLMSDIDPAKTPVHNPNYPGRAPWCIADNGVGSNADNNQGAIAPWCGGAFDEARGRYWQPLGGGHGDYGGNEGYYIDLMVDSPQWVMNFPPSGSTTLIANGLPAGSTPYLNSYVLADGQEASSVYADGRPRAMHSYRKHLYIPGVGLLCTTLGGTFTSTGGGGKQTWLMNETTHQWEWIPQADPGRLVVWSGCAATYDTLRNRVYLQAGGGVRMLVLDLSTWIYSTLGVGNLSNCSGDIGMTYIPGRDVIIKVCDWFATKFVIHDPVTSNWAYPVVAGTPPTGFGARQGYDWVPSLDAFLVKSGVGDIYMLKPGVDTWNDTWQWSLLVSNSSLPADASTGTYSRFGYSKALGGCYSVLHASTKPWFFATE